MAKKYLDDSGMSYFWGKLKDYFQAKLVSGTNIKTINNESVLGSGNIQVPSSVDYIVEQGTSGIWTYRKWNSGIAECWGKGTVNGTWTAWGSVYYIYKSFAYPFTFTSVPVVQAFAQALSSIGSNSLLSVGSYIGFSEETQKSECSVALYRPTAGTNNANYPCDIYVIGRWK